jgi:hypothetical protein
VATRIQLESLHQKLNALKADSFQELLRAKQSLLRDDLITLRPRIDPNNKPLVEKYELLFHAYTRAKEQLLRIESVGYRSNSVSSVQ